MIPSSQRGRGGGRNSKPRGGLNRASSSRGSPCSKQEEGSSFSQVLKVPVAPPFKKYFQDFVIYLLESDKRLFSTPSALSKQYFELDQEFPILNQKIRDYYEANLKETGSFKITHVNLNLGSRYTEIQFSKAFIIGALSLKE